MRILILGAGPAGLFASMSLAEAGWAPIIIERGRSVDQRGKDVSKLYARGILDGDSNVCFGEGGAGEVVQGERGELVTCEDETIWAHGPFADVIGDSQVALSVGNDFVIELVHDECQILTLHVSAIPTRFSQAMWSEVAAQANIVKDVRD